MPVEKTAIADGRNTTLRIRRGRGWVFAAVSCLVATHFPCAAPAQAAAIFLMKVDGSEVRKVVQVEGYNGHGSPRFSHDDKRLAFDASTGGSDTSRVFVVNVDGSGLKQVATHAMPDWSPDDKQLAYHSYGNNAQAGVHVCNLDGQGDTFLTEGGSPRWSPDGSQIAFTDWKTVKLFDLVESEQRILVDEPFESYQIGFDWSPDGKRLAFVGERNGNDELWIANTESGDAQARVRLTADLSRHVAWSHDGKRLAVTIDGKIHLLDVDSDKAPEPVPGQEGKNGDVAWSHDGKWLAFKRDRTTMGQKQIAARAGWKLDEAQLRTNGPPAYSVALFSNGRRAVLGGYTARSDFQVWDMTQNSADSIDFSAVFLALAPNDRTLAVTGMRGKIQLIDMETRQLLRDIGLDGIPTSVRFSKDSARLVSAALNNRVYVCDVATGKTKTIFTKHESFVFRALFTPDGKEVASTGQDKTLRVWDSTTAEQRLEIPHPEVIWGLAVTPDGRQILTGTGGPMPKGRLGINMEKRDDNVLRVWDVASGKLMGEMKGHTQAVYAIDVSADGRLAVSGGWDGTIRVWDLQTLEQVAQANGESSVMDVKFSSDAKQILVGGGDVQFAGEPTRYINNERARVYQLIQVGNAATVVEKK